MRVSALSKVGRSWVLVWSLFTAAAVGCGGASTEAANAGTPTPSAEDESVDMTSEDQPEPANESGGDEASTAPTTSPEDEQPAEQRQIKYIVTSAGLEIEVEGVRFLANAKPVKLKDGWGVKVSVEGKVKDDKRHNVLTPKNGPLAFAGSVTRNGSSTRFGDKREGDANTEVAPHRPIKASREWPGNLDEKPLNSGDSLELEVGLWGIGDTADSRRPVRDLFLLKMVVGEKTPQPLVLPPASTSK